MLEIKGLTKSFQGLQVFSGINLAVENKNEKKPPLIGIIGPNGAGKTTLFNILTGYEKADAGSIVFNGKHILGKKPYDIVREGLARTFQNTLAFHMLTVRDNVLVATYLKENFTFCEKFISPFFGMAKNKAAQQKAMQVLEMLGMCQDADVISSNLPYGKQKKLGIAMGLATEPILLALDEPAAGLNSKETKEMTELLREINQSGVTVLVIEHNMKLIMDVCEQIYVLSNGRIIANGRPEEIARDQRVIDVYLGKGISVGNGK